MELRIKEIAKSKNIRNVELAARIGIARENMSNIMTGKATPSLERLLEIARALDVHISDLFPQKELSVPTITCPYCGREIKIEVK
jgi:transcriptional regulator with XRE-family HTH domain